MQSKINPKSLHNDLVIQELPDELFIYDLRKNKAFCLNQTAAFIWQHADGATPVKQIAYLLQKRLKTPVDESIVWFALEQFEKDGLLENKVAAPMMFAGMNRRQLISAFGKSAAVALPLVNMITAPTAAHAASGLLANGGACTIGSQCTSGSCSASKNTCCAGRGESCSSSSDCCLTNNICSSDIPGGPLTCKFPRGKG
jgi:hypothetical protein